MDDFIKRSPQFVRPSVIHGISRYEQTPNTSLCFQFAILLYQMVTDHAGHFGGIHSLACTTNYGLHRCPSLFLDKPCDCYGRSIWHRRVGLWVIAVRCCFAACRRLNIVISLINSLSTCERRWQGERSDVVITTGAGTDSGVGVTICSEGAWLWRTGDADIYFLLLFSLVWSSIPIAVQISQRGGGISLDGTPGTNFGLFWAAVWVGELKTKYTYIRLVPKSTNSEISSS